MILPLLSGTKSGISAFAFIGGLYYGVPSDMKAK